MSSGYRDSARKSKEDRREVQTPHPNILVSLISAGVRIAPGNFDTASELQMSTRQAVPM
ncbi:hypothetical protein PG990_001717 [Apiospora arundinis]